VSAEQPGAVDAAAAAHALTAVALVRSTISEIGGRRDIRALLAALDPADLPEVAAALAGLAAGFAVAQACHVTCLGKRLDRFAEDFRHIAATGDGGCDCSRHAFVVGVLREVTSRG
jgi:hypothetical protein